jgi:hypothetical protein
MILFALAKKRLANTPAHADARGGAERTSKPCAEGGNERRRWRGREQQATSNKESNGVRELGVKCPSLRVRDPSRAG